MPLTVNSQQFFTDDLLTLQQTGSGAAPSWTANLQCGGWPRGTGGHNEEEGSLRLSRRARSESPGTCKHAEQPGDGTRYRPPSFFDSN